MNDSLNIAPAVGVISSSGLNRTDSNFGWFVWAESC